MKMVEPPEPPDGFELVKEGEYLPGDMYWSIRTREWKEANFRVGKPMDMFYNPAARRKLIVTGAEEGRKSLNHLFGIEDKDMPKTVGDHW